MKYILQGKLAVPIEDTLTWGKWFSENNRIVKQTAIEGVMVSTVFLGIDYNFSNQGDPLLFETMCFALDKGENGEDVWGDTIVWRQSLIRDSFWGDAKRDSNWGDAEVTHLQAIESIKAAAERSKAKAANIVYSLVTAQQEEG